MSGSKDRVGCLGLVSMRLQPARLSNPGGIQGFYLQTSKLGEEARNKSIWDKAKKEGRKWQEGEGTELYSKKMLQN